VCHERLCVFAFEKILQGHIELNYNCGLSQAQPMVRFGEYSPQNPVLLSPGKTLLGLGEYEEKRRQILERKKQEYLERMLQARQEVKDVVSGRIAELTQQQDSSELELKPPLNRKHTAGTQTDAQVCLTCHTSVLRVNEASVMYRSLCAACTG
jgi:hypothetical protein